MTKGLLVSRKKKEKLLKEKLKIRTDESKSNFYEYKRIYEKLIIKAKMAFYKREFESATGNSKKNLGLIEGSYKVRKQKCEIKPSIDIQKWRRRCDEQYIRNCQWL